MTLRVETRRLDTRELATMVRNGHLVPAGDAGGPGWSIDQRAALFDSVERCWPIGPLVAWNPSYDWAQQWYLLDGHRRIAALAEVMAERTDLVRDLGSGPPRYLPAAACAGGVYLPVNAMLRSVSFLHATSGLSGSVVEVADRAASSVMYTLFEVILLAGGTPIEVDGLCRRLLPGRLSLAVVERIAADDAVAPYRAYR